MGLVLAPILEGKLEGWKAWTKDFSTSKKSEFDAFNKRYGLTRHDIWLAETPSGPVAVVLHEGPGGDSFMQKLGQSDNSFDKAMAAKIMEFHGMDLHGPPPGQSPTKMN